MGALSSHLLGGEAGQKNLQTCPHLLERLDLHEICNCILHFLVHDYHDRVHSCVDLPCIAGLDLGCHPVSMDLCLHTDMMPLTEQAENALT